MYFVDNLRSAIIILVILHHVAYVDLIFAAIGGGHPAVASAILGIFLLLNQGWFMGAFFLLSGFFTPGSFARKGPGKFLIDRFVRLGIPILFYSFILGPIATGVLEAQANSNYAAKALTVGRYVHLVNFGPLWFAILLLVFDFGYVAWRAVARNRFQQAEVEPRPLRFRGIAIFVVLLGAASYLIRFVLPLSNAAFLGFPSLYDLPEYASFFCIGVAASQRNWLPRVTGSIGKWGLIVALLSTVILFPIALTGLGTGPSGGFVGGGSWQSAVYALWESIYSVGLFVGLIVVFRHFLDRGGRLSAMLSRQSYAVYVFHFPIVVVLISFLRGIGVEEFLGFVLFSFVAVPLCFGVAYFVRRIPSVARVL